MFFICQQSRFIIIASGVIMKPIRRDIKLFLEVEEKMQIKAYVKEGTRHFPRD
jgi:hypothetical protein